MRILFVSRQDRLRGPMARALAERMAKTEGVHDVVFDSAGLEAPPAEPPDLDAAAFLRSERYNIVNHRSKPLSVPLADGADIILCMTKEITSATKKTLGEYYAPKVVLLNEAIMLATKRMDIEDPDDKSLQALRRVYAAMLASVGRLVRTLTEGDVTPELLGGKSLPKRMAPGTGGGGPKASAQSVDPERRAGLCSLLFDFIERSFEPPTTALLLEHLRSKGQPLAVLELEEILRQDLHGHVRVDHDGLWQVVVGAAQKRKDAQRAQAKARMEQARAQASTQPPPPPPPRKAARLTEPEAMEVLGINGETPAEEVRKKYRALLKRYHPDKFHDDPEFRTMAEEKAKRLNEAWALLKGRYGDGSDGADE